MYVLPIDVMDPTWRRVTDAIATRRAQLLQDALSLTSSDAARRDAAVRIDELDLLASAPTDTARAAIAARDAMPNRAGAY